jgi:hypothetical protein
MGIDAQPRRTLTPVDALAELFVQRSNNHVTTALSLVMQ